jgi:transmembrane sensor
MNEVDLHNLSRRMGSRWTKEREAAARRQIDRRLAHPRTRMRTVAVVAAAAAFAFGVGRWVQWQRAEVAQSSPTLAPTRVTPLVADTRLGPIEPGGRAYSLLSGAARFEVTHDGAHPFRVRTPGFIVEDMGTVFTVKVAADQGVEVLVEEGSVRVLPEADPAHVTTLRGGESKTFSSKEASPEPLAAQTSAWTTIEPPQPLTPSSASASPSSGPSSGPSWKPLAQAGRFDEAFAALGRAGPGTVRDAVDDLLLAADAARLSDHPKEAATYLNRVVEAHADDSRANLAAFTLGRLYLDQLDRPAEAAKEFAWVREKPGPLSENALAHEVEAWSRAGDLARARALALEYRAAYPNGERAKAVAKLGGIE